MQDENKDKPIMESTRGFQDEVAENISKKDNSVNLLKTVKKFLFLNQ